MTTHARTSRLLVAAVVACLLVLAPGGVAQAHTDLVASNPREGQRLERPPTLVELEFSESMDARLSDMSLSVGDDLVGPVSVEPGAGPGTLVARLDSADVPQSSADPDTPWRVDFRVTSVDGHPVTGSVSFIVAAGAPTGSTAPPSASPAGTDLATTPSAEQESSGADGVPERETGSIGSIAVFGGVVLLVVLGALAVSRLRRYEEDEAL